MGEGKNGGLQNSPNQRKEFTIYFLEYHYLTSPHWDDCHMNTIASACVAMRTLIIFVVYNIP